MSIFDDRLSHIKALNPDLPEISPTVLDMEEYERRKCDVYNHMQGGLSDGFDCPDCLNKGTVEVYANGEHRMRECKCMERRRVYRRIKASGLGNVIERYTFDNFQTDEPWQSTLKRNAMAFADDPEARAFFVGGQPGCGKTHICTAICGELLKKGRKLLYVPWRDLLAKLMAVRFDDAEYFDVLQKHRTADVLYIDDLFKTQSGQAPTKAHFEFAFDVINARYSMDGKITLISSEHTIQAMQGYDEAVASRIAEMAGKYKYNLAGEDKNQRWKK